MSICLPGVIALFCRQYDIIKDNEPNNNKDKAKNSSECSTPEHPQGGLLRSNVWDQPCIALCNNQLLEPQDRWGARNLYCTLCSASYKRLNIIVFHCSILYICSCIRRSRISFFESFHGRKGNTLVFTLLLVWLMQTKDQAGETSATVCSIPTSKDSKVSLRSVFKGGFPSFETN